MNIFYLLQLLCAKGTHTLQTKSKLAEESVQELINIIMTYEDPSLQGDDSDAEDDSGEKATEDKDDDDRYAGRKDPALKNGATLRITCQISEKPLYKVGLR